MIPLTCALAFVYSSMPVAQWSHYVALYPLVAAWALSVIGFVCSVLAAPFKEK